MGSQNLECPMPHKSLPDQTDRLITVSDFAEMARPSRRDNLLRRNARPRFSQPALNGASQRTSQCPLILEAYPMHNR